MPGPQRSDAYGAALPVSAPGRLWVVDRCAKQGDIRSGGASPGPRLAQQPQRYPVWFSRQGDNSPLRPIPLAFRWRRGKGRLRAAHSAVSRVAASVSSSQAAYSPVVQPWTSQSMRATSELARAQTICAARRGSRLLGDRKSRRADQVATRGVDRICISSWPGRRSQDSASAGCATGRCAYSAPEPFQAVADDQQNAGEDEQETQASNADS